MHCIRGMTSSRNSSFKGSSAAKTPRTSGKLSPNEKRLEKLSFMMLAESTTQDARAFAEFDVDSNQQLDLDEFIAMQPKEIRDTFSLDEIESCFRLADTDGDGTLSPEEWFNFSLSNAAHLAGADALATAFRKYDVDGTGLLDASEFAAACGELGFRSMAHQIFASLDSDRSGAVSYEEMLAALTSTKAADGATRRLLTALAMGSTKDSNFVTSSIETKGWAIKGRDAPTVQAELRAILLNTGARVADLIALFDDDGGHEGGEKEEQGGGHLSIDEMEFAKTMRMTFKYGGPVRIRPPTHVTTAAGAGKSTAFCRDPDSTLSLRACVGACACVSIPSRLCFQTYSRCSTATGAARSDSTSSCAYARASTSHVPVIHLARSSLPVPLTYYRVSHAQSQACEITPDRTWRTQSQALAPLTPFCLAHLPFRSCLLPVCRRAANSSRASAIRWTSAGSRPL